jgi:hypothetical protein
MGTISFLCIESGRGLQTAQYERCQSAQYERGPLCGLHSRTLPRNWDVFRTSRSVLECASPLPLWESLKMIPPRLIV